MQIEINPWYVEGYVICQYNNSSEQIRQEKIVKKNSSNLVKNSSNFNELLIFDEFIYRNLSKFIFFHFFLTNYNNDEWNFWRIAFGLLDGLNTSSRTSINKIRTLDKLMFDQM